LSAKQPKAALPAEWPCHFIMSVAQLPVLRPLPAKIGNMEVNLQQERQQAHALIDLLSAEKLNAVRSLLEVMVEPLSRSLAQAPLDDQEIPPEGAVEPDEARASLARGEG